MLQKRTNAFLEKTSEQPIKPSVAAPAPAVAAEEAIPAQQTAIKPTAVLLGIVGGFIGHWMGGPTSAAVVGPHVAAIAEGIAEIRRYRR